MRNGGRWIAIAILSCLALTGIVWHTWSGAASGLLAAGNARPTEWDEPIQPIEPWPDLDARKVVLGRKLFEDPRFSRNNQVSCASCHDLQAGGTDRKAKSIGINGAIGEINAPTVFNSGFNFSQFWDGRAATLEEQIDGPLQSRAEMGSNWTEVIAKLARSPDYVRSFHDIYGGDLGKEHVKDAIAVFERSLSTPNSRFDRYLRHEANALNGRQLDGYRLFKLFGCASCHQGVGVGGNMYQKLGVMVPYFTEKSKITRADKGRFNVTGDPQDMYMFKVPSLRNVELTAPYFHDGSAATLSDAVRMMAKYQLSHPLTDEQVEAIVEFLKTLTGQWNGKPL